jgi:hypothetical protein
MKNVKRNKEFFIVSTNAMTLVVDDATIITFYEQNPHLDFITMNHIFIDVLSKLSTQMSDTIASSANMQILKQLDIMKEDKQHFVNDVKTVISKSELDINMKMKEMVEHNNDLLLARTQVMLADVIPKTHDTLHTNLNGCLQQMTTNILSETGKFMELAARDDTAIKSYFDAIDTHFGRMTNNIYTPIISFIQSSEERTSKNIDHLKENVGANLIVQNNLSGEITQFLNRYKYNSSIKGSISETELYGVLQKLFPIDEIIDCASDTATCDYRVNRLDKKRPTILFENKDYVRTVSTDEVTKFERDLKKQGEHGIFISQNSSITFKENFHIDIIDKRIHVYISNAQYCPNKIKIGVDIIDALSQKLLVIDNKSVENGSASFVLSEKNQKLLVEEYLDFVKQKTQIISDVKQSHKLLVDGLEKLHLNVVKKILTSSGALEPDMNLKCKYCDVFIGKNKASLGAHVRKCEKKKDI